MSTFQKTAATYKQGAMTLARDYYVSPEVFHDEQERLFRQKWVCVGRSEQIAKNGEYFLAMVAGESLIILRDQESRLRGFYNICRHRGTRLCEEHTGRFSGSIQCPYHAWTYSTDGQLIGAPHMNEVAGFDRRAFPLHDIAVHEWEGFLFVNLARDPEPFEVAFAPVLTRFSRFSIASLRSARRIEYDVKSNWKLLFQNYSECLHCPMIHPGLTRVTPYLSGENDLTEGSYLGGFMVISQQGGSMTESGNPCGVTVGTLAGDDLQRAYYYSLMPNLLLSMHPDYVMAHTLWPVAPDRTRIVCDWLFHPESFENPEYDPQDGVRFWDTVNRQDWHICEQSQLGVSSRAYVPGPYSPRESVPAAWDREYLRLMGR
jgi:glycine betaine catabolism A